MAAAMLPEVLAVCINSAINSGRTLSWKIQDNHKGTSVQLFFRDGNLAGDHNQESKVLVPPQTQKRNKRREVQRNVLMLSSRLNVWNVLLNHGLKTPRKTDSTLSNQTAATSIRRHGQKLLLYMTDCRRLLLDFRYMTNLHRQVIVPSRILLQLHLTSPTGLSVLPNLLLGMKHPAKCL
jgi:hypothetical protein